MKHNLTNTPPTTKKLFMTNRINILIYVFLMLKLTFGCDICILKPSSYFFPENVSHCTGTFFSEINKCKTKIII